MTYLIHPEPYKKHLCQCGYYFLTPQSQPAEMCPDCVNELRYEKHIQKLIDRAVQCRYANAYASKHRAYYKEYALALRQRQKEQSATT